MRKLVIAISMLASVATASANPTFYNASPTKLTVEATFPNGKVEKRTLGDGSTSVVSEYFMVPPGVDKLAIKVTDDTGAELWRGASGPNDVHVMLPDGNKVKGVFAGHYSGTGDTPKGAVFINQAGEPITVDLVGMNGVGAHRGLKPGAAFDLKAMVKLDPKEASFGIEVKTKGDPFKIDGARVTPGRYYLISKHPQYTYRLLSLGHIPAPPAPAKKPKK